ncbi:MAG: alpha/beta fold hydrolase, partial [Microbacteriaceae bacterium]|nr:alpha/beta fold hydrolase [Microbacteriaceae bacterium]
EQDIATASPHWDVRDVRTKATALGLVLREAVERTFDENGAWDLRAEAAAIPVPTLLLTGDPEVFALVPPALAEEIAAANPRLTYRTVPGAGHAPHRDRPAETLSVVDDWLARA